MKRTSTQMASQNRDIKSRYRYMKHMAKKRGLACELSIIEYRTIISFPCFYCNGPTGATGIGLDRQDNKRGYVKGNVVSCCGSCNYRKGKLESIGFTFPRTIELLREVISITAGQTFWRPPNPAKDRQDKLFR